MKIISIALMVVCLLVLIASIAFAILGVWTGDARFAETCLIAVLVSIGAGVTGGLTWPSK